MPITQTWSFLILSLYEHTVPGVPWHTVHPQNTASAPTQLFMFLPLSRFPKVNTNLFAAIFIPTAQPTAIVDLLFGEFYCLFLFNFFIIKSKMLSCSMHMAKSAQYEMNISFRCKARTENTSKTGQTCCLYQWFSTTRPWSTARLQPPPLLDLKPVADSLTCHSSSQFP